MVWNLIVDIQSKVEFFQKFLKQNSKHEMIPDYSKPSLISISTEEGSISFTAPSNGYIIGSGFGDGQAKNFLYLHCGDVSIRQQGNSNENIGSIFPVKRAMLLVSTFVLVRRIMASISSQQYD